MLGCLSLSHVSTLISLDSISLSLQVTIWLVQLDNKPLDPPPVSSPKHWSYSCAPRCPAFDVGEGDLNSGPCALPTGTLPTEPCPSAQNALYKAFKLARDFHTNQWALGTLHEQIVIGPVVPTYTGILSIQLLVPKLPQALQGGGLGGCFLQPCVVDCTLCSKTLNLSPDCR